MKNDKVDLDLVELRAKLRGWHAERRTSEHGTEEVYVVRSDIEQSCAYWFGPNVYRGGTTLQRSYAWPWAIALTSPSLTLADIVAHPPDGWRVQSSTNTSALFLYGADPKGFPGASVEWWSDVTPNGRVDDLASVVHQIEAHRAIADLLVLLGEVEV